ncbi:hypothetical protein GA0115254_105845 [Streptomyces sp. Ncost-T10-10d]|nr:hypothetical protein GA0115254_105845 [Streptomyces sp. Ncost-T10-10d]
MSGSPDEDRGNTCTRHLGDGYRKCALTVFVPSGARASRGGAVEGSLPLIRFGGSGCSGLRRLDGSMAGKRPVGPTPPS